MSSLFGQNIKLIPIEIKLSKISHKFINILFDHSFGKLSLSYSQLYINFSIIFKTTIKVQQYCDGKTVIPAFKNIKF